MNIFAFVLQNWIIVVFLGKIHVCQVLRPLLPFTFLPVFYWTDIRVHPVLVQGFALGNITNIQSDFILFLAILNTEIKPLNVASSVGIDSEEKIKFKWFGFDDTVQIARLKSTVEKIFLFQVESGVHAFESSVIDSRLVKVIIS